MEPTGIDFTGIFQLIILILIIVWYVYNISKQARKMEKEELEKKKKAGKQVQVKQVPQWSQQKESQDPGLDLLKDIFGINMPDIVRDPIEDDGVVYTKTKKKVEPPKEIKQETIKKEDIVPDKIERIKQQNIQAKKQNILKQTSQKSTLHFSDDPLIQAIIASEVLGKPKGLT